MVMLCERFTGKECYIFWGLSHILKPLSNVGATKGQFDTPDYNDHVFICLPITSSTLLEGDLCDAKSIPYKETGQAISTRYRLNKSSVD